MIRIQHNQTGDVTEVSFTNWEHKYAHEFYTVIEFTDMVVFYQVVNGKKSEGQIVTEEHAKRMVAKSTTIGYVPYTFAQYKLDFICRNGERTKPFVADISKIENIEDAPDFVQIYEDAKKDVKDESSINDEPKPVDYFTAKSKNPHTIGYGIPPAPFGVYTIPTSGNDSAKHLSLLGQQILEAKEKNSGVNPFKNLSLASNSLSEALSKSIREAKQKQEQEKISPEYDEGFDESQREIEREQFENEQPFQQPKRNMELKSIDDIIERLKVDDMLFEREEATDSEVQAIADALKEQIIYRAGNPFYKLAPLGKKIKDSGLTYTDWLKRKYLTNNITTIDELLHFIEDKNGISTHKMTPPSEQKLIDKAYRKKFIYKENNNFYKLDDLGHDFIDSGLNYEQFIERIKEKPSSTTIHTTINGDNNTVPTDVNNGNYLGEVRKVNNSNIEQMKVDRGLSADVNPKNNNESHYDDLHRRINFLRNLTFSWLAISFFIVLYCVTIIFNISFDFLNPIIKSTFWQAFIINVLSSIIFAGLTKLFANNKNDDR